MTCRRDSAPASNAANRSAPRSDAAAFDGAAGTGGGAPPPPVAPPPIRVSNRGSALSVTRVPDGHQAACPCSWKGKVRTGLHGLMAAIGDDDGHAQRHHFGWRRVDLDIVYSEANDPGALRLFEGAGQRG